MKHVFILGIVASLAAAIPESVIAQSSSKQRLPAKSTIGEVGGVETIKPQEAPSKDAADGNGWTGAYVGVNAGGSFGATAGTNVVVPIGTSGKSEK